MTQDPVQLIRARDLGVGDVIVGPEAGDPEFTVHDKGPSLGRTIDVQLQSKGRFVDMTYWKTEWVAVRRPGNGGRG